MKVDTCDNTPNEDPEAPRPPMLGRESTCSMSGSSTRNSSSHLMGKLAPREASVKLVSIQVPRGTQAGDRLVIQMQTGTYACSVPAALTSGTDFVNVSVPLPEGSKDADLIVAFVLVERNGKLLPGQRRTSFGDMLFAEATRLMKGLFLTNADVTLNAMSVNGFTLSATPYDKPVVHAADNGQEYQGRLQTHPHVQGLSIAAC